MTKRSTVTLFALLALIAAFGLILTGCPDPNSSSSTTTETKWRDPPLVKIANVLYVENGTDDNAITFDVVLPEGNEWDWDEVNAAQGSLDTLFTVETHASAQDAVDLWTYSAAPTHEDPEDDDSPVIPNILSVSLAASGGYTQLSITKVSVRLNSLNIRELIVGNPYLYMNLQETAWNFDWTAADAPAKITVGDVALRNSNSGSNATEVDVTLIITGGAWHASFEETLAADFITLTADGSTVLTGYTGTAIADVPTGKKVTLQSAANAITNYGVVAVTLKGDADLSSDIAASGVPMVDLESTGKNATVRLAPGSQGKASDGAIVNLVTNLAYVVKATDSEGAVTWYKTTGTGELTLMAGGLTASDIAADTVPTVLADSGTHIQDTVITNGKTYDVYVYGTVGSADAQTIPTNLANSAKNIVANVSGLAISKNFSLTTNAGIGDDGSGTTTIIFVLAGAITTDVPTETLAAGQAAVCSGSTIRYTAAAPSAGGTGVTFTAKQGEHFFTLKNVNATTAVAFATSV